MIILKYNANCIHYNIITIRKYTPHTFIYIIHTNVIQIKNSYKLIYIINIYLFFTWFGTYEDIRPADKFLLKNSCKYI